MSSKFFCFCFVVLIVIGSVGCTSNKKEPAPKTPEQLAREVAEKVYKENEVQQKKIRDDALQELLIILKQQNEDEKKVKADALKEYLAIREKENAEAREALRIKDEADKKAKAELDKIVQDAIKNALEKAKPVDPIPKEEPKKKVESSPSSSYDKWRAELEPKNTKQRIVALERRYWEVDRVLQVQCSLLTGNWAVGTRVSHASLPRYMDDYGKVYDGIDWEKWKEQFALAVRRGEQREADRKKESKEEKARRLEEERSKNAKGAEISAKINELATQKKEIRKELRAEWKKLYPRAHDQLIHSWEDYYLLRAQFL